MIHGRHQVVTYKSRKVIETENPNGYDPLFNWTIVHANEFLESYNVTYLGSVTKLRHKVVFPFFGGKTIFTETRDCVEFIFVT